MGGSSSVLWPTLSRSWRKRLEDSISRSIVSTPQGFPTMNDPGTADLIRAHGLTPEEYERITHLLGREPNLTELGIFSVMWSEHCSYKSSRVHLRRLPTKGACVLQGPGENAGIVDIGGGLAAAFKIE